MIDSGGKVKHDSFIWRGSLRGLLIAVATAFLVPLVVLSQTPDAFFSPIMIIVLTLALLWPITLVAVVAIVVLAIKRRYTIAIGVVIIAAVLCVAVIQSRLNVVG